MIIIRPRTLVIGLGLLIAAIVVTAGFIWNSSASASALKPSVPVKAEAAAPEPPRPTPAPTVVAAPARVVTYVAKSTGTLISANQATLGFQSSGRIKDIKVKEGDRVKAGDMIATLDTASLEAQVTQAQATLDSAIANLAKIKTGPTRDDVIVARSNVDRAKAALDQAQAAYDKIGGASNPSIAASQPSVNLEQAYSTYQAAVAQYNLTVGHPTDAELKAAQATVAQSQAALETAKQNAANARITAPFDGTVVWLGSKLGESASAGSAEVTIADLPHMQVQVNADEISGANIQVGQSVSITLNALSGKTLTGRVSKIGLLASASGNLVSTPVTIDIDSNNMLVYPGLSATVEFQGGAK